MLRKIAVLCSCMLLVACLAACGKETTVAGRKAAATVEITDMLGRKVTVPRDIKKIYGTSPIATMLVYSIDPAKLVGKSTQSADSGQYIAETYRSLPVVGGMFGAEGTNANMEKIVRAAPDIIISAAMADIGESATDEDADRIQNQLRIPVVVVNGNLTQLDKTYAFLGDLLSEQERARELADYCRHTLSDIGSMVENIPEEKRVRVYYAKGPTGLATDPSGSRHTEVLDFVRGINVAQVPLNRGPGPGRASLNPGSGQSSVSLEKVMLWNPDVIIANVRTNSGGFYDYVSGDDRWANIKAVKERQIYDIPNKPFSWFDQPPSFNRLIGVKWLANLLYPDYVKLDIKSEVKQFYKLFYRVELTDQEVEDLLRGSPQKPE